MVGSLYFDLQVRDRQARILNFFLKYLTLPSERRKLKLRDPERYNWHPGRLVAQLASLHISLFRRDAGAWVEACVADTDYLGNAPDIFKYLDQVPVAEGGGGACWRKAGRNAWRLAGVCSSRCAALPGSAVAFPVVDRVACPATTSCLQVLIRLGTMPADDLAELRKLAKRVDQV